MDLGKPTGKREGKAMHKLWRLWTWLPRHSHANTIALILLLLLLFGLFGALLEHLQ